MIAKNIAAIYVSSRLGYCANLTAQQGSPAELIAPTPLPGFTDDSQPLQLRPEAQVALPCGRRSPDCGSVQPGRQAPIQYYWVWPHTTHYMPVVNKLIGTGGENASPGVQVQQVLGQCFKDRLARGGILVLDMVPEQVLKPWLAILEV